MKSQSCESCGKFYQQKLESCPHCGTKKTKIYLVAKKKRYPKQKECHYGE